MKKYEIKEKNNFKLFPKKLFGLPRLFGFALFGFAQHPCKINNRGILRYLKRVARCLALSLTPWQRLGCLAAHAQSNVHLTIRIRLRDPTLRTHNSISRFFFGFWTHGSFRPLHRLTDIEVWLILHSQYLQNNSILFSFFRH